MVINQTEQKESMIKKGWWMILLIVIFFIAPTFLSEFYLTVLCEALVMSLFALSFNLLFGYMGQLSFGQAAFYGLGGYTVAMLIMKAHFNFWLSIIAGVLVASVIGLIVGFFLCPSERNLFCRIDTCLRPTHILCRF